jgi:hypothetical protein
MRQLGCEVVQHVEDALRDGVLEVAGPPVRDHVDAGQHVSEVFLRCPVRERADLRLHRPDRPGGDEGVDIPLARAPLALPLEAVAGEPASGPGGEQRAVRAGAELGEPGSEHVDGLAGQGCCPVFAALAVAADVRPGAQVVLVCHLVAGAGVAGLVNVPL